MRYQLLNKDNIIAVFKAQGGGSEMPGFFYDVHYIVSDVYCPNEQLLPYSDMYGRERLAESERKLEILIDRWLSSRCAATYNFRVASLYRRFEIDEADRFIHRTHAASLNDTFWVKAEDEDLSWAEVSLYRKQCYDSSISSFCLGDRIDWGDGTEPDFSAAPELLTNGSF